VEHLTTIDRQGIDEMRIRASALLCKTYLHYMHKISEWEDFPQLWCKILDMLETYMKTEDSDVLVLLCRESL
jgi:brefeldin A-resistance guanine nucleotide exchange factor 1